MKPLCWSGVNPDFWGGAGKGGRAEKRRKKREKKGGRGEKKKKEKERNKTRTWPGSEE
jgi:hypothetical protein